MQGQAQLRVLLEEASKAITRRKKIKLALDKAKEEEEKAQNAVMNYLHATGQDGCKVNGVAAASLYQQQSIKIGNINKFLKAQLLFLQKAEAEGRPLLDELFMHQKVTQGKVFELLESVGVIAKDEKIDKKKAEKALEQLGLYLDEQEKFSLTIDKKEY